MDLDKIYTQYLKTGLVTTDSRSVPDGAVFIALRGENHDGNAHAAAALEKGASIAVVDDKGVAKEDRYVVVENGLEALQKLARHHRDQLKIPVIGLTGSNGKTTTKELIKTVLSQKFKTFATKGNLNNHIGVPLSLLSISKDIELAVIEMGANHVGEIAALCEIAAPTHGLITNIGKAHIGMFGGFENIVRAKSELYQYLLTHDGEVWINSSDPTLSNMGRRFPHPFYYIGKDTFYPCEFLASDPYILLKTEAGEKIQTHLIGKYNFENIAAALCIGKYFGVDTAKAHQSIATFAPGDMRSEVIQKGSNTIILDAYNANPSSMKVALENIAQMKGRRVVILGDMAELGEETENEHRALGKILSGLSLDEIYLVGEDMEYTEKEIPTARYFLSPTALKEFLKSDTISDSTILVKGSRRMKLEEILEVI